MTADTQNRTAIIIGGNNALMEHIASMLSDKSIKVVLLTNISWNPEAKLSPTKKYERIAFTDEQGLLSAADNVVKQYGRVDLLIFCVLPDASAGRSGRLPDTETGFWKQTKENGINLLYNASRVLLANMAANGGGRVLVFGSVSGVIPVTGQDALSAMSAAACMLVKSIAVDSAADGICANAVALGPVSPDLGVEPLPVDDALMRHIPLNRVCTLAEILNLAEYLLLFAPPSLSGNTILLDGAFSTSYMRDY